MFAPTYHESASGNRVEYATSVTCAIQASSADGFASIVEYPCDLRYTTQSLIQSTCCSIDSTVLLNTDGDPGPVTMNMFGNPAATIPRYERGPDPHFSASGTPPTPRMSIRLSAPEIASNPVANTSASSS